MKQQIPALLAEKASLRRRIAQSLRTMSAALRCEKSRVIARKLSQDKRFQKAEHILIYLPLKSEVDLRALIQQQTQLGKRFYVTVVSGRSQVLRITPLYRNGKIRRTRINRLGVSEPVINRRERYVSPESIDMAIVPGLVFTRSGRRLGRGKGYFDRLLAKMKNARFIGVCFRKQLLKRIPVQSHDIKMHQVISG